MRLLTNWLEELKETFRDNPKKIYLSVSLCIAAIVGLFLIVLFSRTSIRENQLEALIYPQIVSEKLIPLTYNQETEKIKKTEAISVLFVKPSSPDYHAILKTLEKQGKELNRSIYFYPLVYQTEQIAKQFQINEEEATFVFFEKGIEKNRFTFQSIEEPEKNMIPELNRLPMWNIKVIEATEEAQKNKNELTQESQ